MVWLTWAIPLIVVIFVWTLNEFLRGRLKEVISGVSALLIFALCIVAFFVSGWIIGLVALIGSFALAALFRYPAFLIAKKLVKYPDLGVADHSQRRSQRMMNDLASGKYFERLETEKQEESRHKARTVEKAVSRSDVQDVLERLSCTKRDVEAFYERFEISSLPPHMREIAVCNANMLDYYLQNSVEAEVNGEYVRNVKDQNVAMTLTLWARHDPKGRQP